MTLAKQCNAIWPIGWESTGREDVAIATVDGVALRCEKNTFLVNGRNYAGYEDLRLQMQSMREIVLCTPRRVPNLAPDPTPQQQAEEILVEQGWVRNPAGWHVQGGYMVGVNQHDCALGSIGSGNGRPIRSVDITQGNVREQLRELLTFPAWKEP